MDTHKGRGKEGTRVAKEEELRTTVRKSHGVIYFIN